MNNNRWYWIVSLMGLFVVVLIMQPTENAENDVTIVKNPSDEKTYRYVKLDNSLEAILVSDPDATQSAASLDVSIGSSSNPKDWQGLAHFLEHMLFLGTKKYPKAGEYQQFISNHGGGNNAYTSYENTNYFFDIPNKYFPAALDRFSRFFIDPVFETTYINKERENVNSEYLLYKKNDARRLAEVRKVLLNPDHPAANFSVGSNETLRDREGQTLRQALLAFYEKYYSANLMKLAVVSNASLDEQEKWVRAKFSGVKNHKTPKPLFNLPYKVDTAPKILFVVPHKQLRSVTFSFDVPSTKEEYRSKPFTYLSNLIGDEGKGSLFALLKGKGWAESLSAGLGFIDDVHGEFRVIVGLTEEGVEHVKQIGYLLFAYIDLVNKQGVTDWRFEEKKQLSEIDFEFAENSSNPSDLARSLAARLHFYDTQDVLAGPYMMEEFNSRRLLELMSYLTPDNINVHLVSQGLETNAITPYYGTEYRLEYIDESWLADWQAAKVDEQFALPLPNPFIAEKLIINDVVDSPVDHPVLFENIANVKLWHKRDVEFKAPRAEFYINIMSPVANGNPRDSVLTRLMVSLVNKQLNEYVYPAYLAGLNYSLYSHGHGITLRTSGFEEKQGVLLNIVLQALANPDFESLQFTIIKQALTRKWQNMRKNRPTDQTAREIHQLIFDPLWTTQEKLDALSLISLEDVKQHYQRYFKKVVVQALSYGDIDADMAQKQTKQVMTMLADKHSQFIDNVSRPTIRRLDRGKSYIRNLDIAHHDSSLGVYYQAPNNSFEDRAKVALISHLMAPGFFYQLRTVNKVGYSVQLFNLLVDNYPGLVMLAQSPTFSPDGLYQMYTQFIDTFFDELKKMPQEQFVTAKRGLIDILEQEDQKLSQRSNGYWNEIQQEEYLFDSREKIIAILENLDKEKIIFYYQSFISDNASSLVVQSRGEQEDVGEAGEISDVKFIPIESTKAFRDFFNQ